MSISSKIPKTNVSNPNSNYKPPIENHIPIVEIIHSKDGAYDVYIDNQWRINYNHIDNVLQRLSNHIGTFTLKFKDRCI